MVYFKALMMLLLAAMLNLSKLQDYLGILFVFNELISINDVGRRTSNRICDATLHSSVSQTILYFEP